jgi:hypothetical protein
VGRKTRRLGIAKRLPVNVRVWLFDRLKGVIDFPIRWSGSRMRKRTRADQRPDDALPWDDSCGDAEHARDPPQGGLPAGRTRSCHATPLHGGAG